MRSIECHKTWKDSSVVRKTPYLQACHTVQVHFFVPLQFILLRARHPVRPYGSRDWLRGFVNANKVVPFLFSKLS